MIPKGRFCEDCQWADMDGKYIPQTMESPAEFPEFQGCNCEEESVEMLWEIWESVKAFQNFEVAEFCREYKERD